jgi:hypothetical protein
VDGSGSIYAAGTSFGTVTYGFGNGVTTAGTAASPNSQNVLLVKFDSLGQAQWARSLTAGDNKADFRDVAADGSGVYAVGLAYQGTTYGLGNGVTVTGASTAGLNVLLVKYDSSGQTQWARTLTAGSGGAIFQGVTTDGSGGIYAAGYSVGTETYGFGNGVTAASPVGGSNVLLVKYR